jgi:RNA polymerase sigma factor (sigma-70 family)
MVKQMADSQELLGEYVKNGSESAFREVVARYVDLVYSAAVRLVNGDTHLAQDVTQIVFVDLARMARTFSPHIMLGGWLHRHTCFVASKTMRTERRRQTRERIAMEMNALGDHTAANLGMVAPIIDEAVNQLGAEDRQAILLRFFEQRDFRAVGEALGSNEEAARKRVNRALEKLQILLKHRGVVLSSAGLATALGAGVVTAAPVGLGSAIAGTALLSATASTATFTFLNVITMTKLQAGITGAIALALAIPLVMQYKSQSKLRADNEALREEVAKVSTLKAENERLARIIAQTTNAPRQSNDQVKELMKLRGEVGRLRQENASDAANKTNGPSALSGITATPEMQKMIRDQQKMGLNAIYRDLAKSAKLSKEQTEKLNDLLADHVMTNINNITTILHDHKPPTEMNQVFTDQDNALLQNVQSLLGTEGLEQYQDYTRNLISHLTSEQFKGMLSGDDATKKSQADQLYKVMQEESRQALARAGLDPDYQLVPTLNFRNFASAEDAEKNLTLLDGVYGSVAEKAKAFLSPDDAQKFSEFRTKALNNNRVALEMNRKLMAPTSK